MPPTVVMGMAYALDAERTIAATARDRTNAFIGTPVSVQSFCPAVLEKSLGAGGSYGTVVQEGRPLRQALPCTVSLRIRRAVEHRSLQKVVAMATSGFQSPHWCSLA